jgi:phospholipid/cholesterol/gamma-HCH transport system ATP-binding protein
MSGVTDGTAISLRGIRVAFGARVVLDGLDLAVPAGTNFVLMGLSGTGKSVTLKAMAGLLPVDAGEVQVSGVRVLHGDRKSVRTARKGMGFLFQNSALIRWLTALENVALPLVETGVAEDEAHERARSRLEAVGLTEAADRYPDALSGGMQKRVGFARATVTDPRVILYDEPTTGLDPITKRTIDDLVVRGRDEFGATGVVVSHDVGGALRVADWIGLLYEGRLAVVARPREFLESEHPVVREFVRDSRPEVGSEG